MPTVTEVPPATIGPAASAGTSYSVRVALPVPELCGSTRIVYLPVAGSVFVSTKPPFVPIGMGGTSVVPSGLAIESVIEQQVDAPNVTLPTFRLIRCPAEPSKTSVAFSPAAVVVTVRGEPSGAIG